jgi:hypothetical protein
MPIWLRWLGRSAAGQAGRHWFGPSCAHAALTTPVLRTGVVTLFIPGGRPPGAGLRPGWSGVGVSGLLDQRLLAVFLVGRSITRGPSPGLPRTRLGSVVGAGQAALGQGLLSLQAARPPAGPGGPGGCGRSMRSPSSSVSGAGSPRWAAALAAVLRSGSIRIQSM